MKAAWIWLVRDPGVVAAKWKGSGGSSELQHSLLASIPGGYDTGTSWNFSGNNGTSSQQKLLVGSFQTDDVDAIIFSFVNVMFYVEVKVSVT